jgi:hypothetical protein
MAPSWVFVGVETWDGVVHHMSHTCVMEKCDMAYEYNMCQQGAAKIWDTCKQVGYACHGWPMQVQHMQYHAVPCSAMQCHAVCHAWWGAWRHWHVGTWAWCRYMV